jgi:sulfonate transport system substrate-binding protein
MSSSSSSTSTSSQLPTIRLTSVPEHFLYPVQLALDRGIFKKHGIICQFIEEPLGTGKMITDLKQGHTDIIIALTEGLVYDISNELMNSNGNTSANGSIALLGAYVETPLTWSISVGGKNKNISSIEEMMSGEWGISRYGSGSHLMTCVLATSRGWSVDELRFQVCGNFQALRDYVNAHDDAAFMWNTEMQQPYYAKGEIKRIGEITTPWSVSHYFMYIENNSYECMQHESECDDRY